MIILAIVTLLASVLLFVYSLISVAIDPDSTVIKTTDKQGASQWKSVPLSDAQKRKRFAVITVLSLPGIALALAYLL